LACLAPKGPAAPIKLQGLTSCPEEQELVLSDTIYRYPGDIMNKTGEQVLQMIERAKTLLPLMRLPFKCVHGEQDTIALPSGSQYLYDNAGTAVGSKQIEFFPNLRHELFHEKFPSGSLCIETAASFLMSILMVTESTINTVSIDSTSGDIQLNGITQKSI
jgi:alpha-beta hydrolase superfamily lysophospholipase